MFGIKLLEEKQSKYNGTVSVKRSLGFGTYVQAGGLTQSGGVVGVIWKPTLKKLINSKFSPKKILILGLGGGTVAKYSRLYWRDSEIAGVDIDPVMVELGNKYLGLDTTGVKTKIGDASEYVSNLKKGKEKFDLVVVDLYNGDEFPEKFGKDTFLKNISDILQTNGVTVFNRLYYGEKRKQAEKFGVELRKHFKTVKKFKPTANLIYFASNLDIIDNIG